MGILSTTGHVKPCGKLGGPSSKAKYHLMTDSELVPRGKGEKNPGRGVKENVKPCAYKQSEAARLMVCLLKNDPASYSMQQG